MAPKTAADDGATAFEGRMTELTEPKSAVIRVGPRDLSNASRARVEAPWDELGWTNGGWLIVAGRLLCPPVLYRGKGRILFRHTSCPNPMCAPPPPESD